MRIAIVGAGIAGLVCAWRLHRHHEITVFEAADRVGGHTHTVEVEEEDGVRGVDTGFIVFNERHYPRFTALLDELGVASQASNMGFSVRDERDGTEYRGSSLNTLFAQRRNLLRPSFHRMVGDILRFYREAPALLEAPGGESLGAYLRRGGYSRAFIEQHILPMGAALWSSGPEIMDEFPARHFVEFFRNHDLLRLRGRPRWKVIRGGSHQYVKALLRRFGDRVRTGTPVLGVRRDEDGVLLRLPGGETARFDQVILACHSDQALAMLDDPRPAEREVLGAMPYQANEVALHTDSTVMPRARRAWACWNYHVTGATGRRAAVTYHMNDLQSFEGAPRDYFVTLNRTGDLAPGTVLGDFVYHHPLFTADAVAAQGRRAEISGVDRTWYCGAYWGWGFHEDGVRSAEAVCAELGEGVPA